VARELCWVEDVGRATRLAMGDAECWRAFLPECRCLVRRAATAIGLGAGARPDVEQSVLADFWEKRRRVFGGFLGRSSLSTYLYPAISWHVMRARSCRRRLARRCRLVEPDRLEHLAADDPFGAGDDAAGDGAREPGDGAVDDLIHALPPRQQEIVRLARAGLSWPRVAAAAGITRDAARKSFAKAIRRLRVERDERFPPCVSSRSK